MLFSRWQETREIQKERQGQQVLEKSKGNIDRIRGDSITLSLSPAVLGNRRHEETHLAGDVGVGHSPSPKISVGLFLS